MPQGMQKPSQIPAAQAELGTNRCPGAGVYGAAHLRLHLLSHGEQVAGALQLHLRAGVVQCQEVASHVHLLLEGAHQLCLQLLRLPPCALGAVQLHLGCGAAERGVRAGAYPRPPGPPPGPVPWMWRMLPWSGGREPCWSILPLRRWISRRRSEMMLVYCAMWYETFSRFLFTWGGRRAGVVAWSHPPSRPAPHKL